MNNRHTHAARRTYSRTGWMTLGACGLLLLSETPSVAQEPEAADLGLEVSGGVALPVGAAAKASGNGPAFAVVLNHRLGERFVLLTEFQHAAFLGKGQRIVESTDIIMSRVSLGVGMLHSRQESGWRVASRFSVGVARIGSDPVRSLDDTRFDITKINADVLSLGGAIKIERTLGGFVSFFRTGVDLHFAGSRLAALRSLDPAIGDSGPIVGIPLYLGIRFDL